MIRNAHKAAFFLKRKKIKLPTVVLVVIEKNEAIILT